MSILHGLIGAAAYGFLAYIKKVQKGEKFEPMKLVATCAMGLVIGAIMWASKIEFNQVNIATQWAIYAGSVGFAENAIKFIWRAIKKGM